MLAFATLANASPLLLTSSYTATPGEGVAQGGSMNYFDDTGNQLTDGVYGVDEWHADLGNGEAYEWVAWKTASPTFTFSFDTPVTVESVNIDFNRSDGDGIDLPSSVTIGGTLFSLLPDLIADSTRGTLSFTGSWTGSNLSVTLNDGDVNKWIFVDEVTFNGTLDPVPEPSEWLAVGLGLALLAAWRFRRYQSGSVGAGPELG